MGARNCGKEDNEVEAVEDEKSGREWTVNDTRDGERMEHSITTPRVLPTTLFTIPVPM